MRLQLTRWAAVAAAALALSACDSPLEVDPRTQIPAEEALTNAAAVRAAVNGAYSALQTQALYDRELTAYPELYADNLDFTGTFTTDSQVDNMDIAPSNGAMFTVWRDAYAGINRSNEVLAAIPGVTDFAGGEAERYRGEALFLRGVHYFNLVRYFGGVPLVLDPTRDLEDVKENTRPRSTRAEVYARVEADLEEAETLLGEARANGRATAWAARALLARVYLEEGKWAEARDLATQVIEEGPFQLVSNYRDLFEIKNSAESVWEVQYTINDPNSQAFWAFPYALGGRISYAPSLDLLLSYEEEDERFAASVDYDETDGYYARKFFRIAAGDDNVIVLRLAEMYLARAEANLRLGAPAATVRADIDAIRERAGLDALSGDVDTVAELELAIAQERRVEFAFEGHRFFDLRRLGLADDVLGEDVPLVFPIPQLAIDRNPQLEQNAGY